MADLFASTPRPEGARPKLDLPPNPTFGETARPAPSTDAVSLRCRCGAWAHYGFGYSPLRGTPGLRLCRTCALADGRIANKGGRSG